MCAIFLSKKEKEIGSRILAKRKHVPEKKTLVIAYTEENKFSIFVVESEREPEFICDVDGILCRYDTAINNGHIAMKSDINDTINALKTPNRIPKD